MRAESKIMIAVAVVAISAGTILFIKGNPKPQEAGKPIDNSSLVRESSQTIGPKDAKVTIVEFGDYQCPACGLAHPIIKEVLAKYKDSNNLKFVFRNFPLNIHNNAQISAEAAEAAGEQGKFWEMHDLIYENQNEWSESNQPLEIFVGYGAKIGLDTTKFRSALESHKFRQVVRTDLEDGEKLGVNSTPTFYINGEKQTGVPSSQALSKIIDEKLK